MINLQVAREKSLKNCHVRGLHSVVLNEDEKGLLRVFYTSQDHELWQNQPAKFRRMQWYGCNSEMPISIAIHPHHSEFAFTVLSGTITNVEFGDEMSGISAWGRAISMPKWKWTSAILNGQGRFELVDNDSVIYLGECHIYSAGQKFSMLAAQMHTVFVPYGMEAMWMIREIASIEPPPSYCWSNADLSKWSDKDLYQKFDVDELEEIIEKIRKNLQNLGFGAYLQ